MLRLLPPDPRRQRLGVHVLQMTHKPSLLPGLGTQPADGDPRALLMALLELAPLAGAVTQTVYLLAKVRARMAELYR